MSNRWNIFIESIPDHDNSIKNQINENHKVMSIPNRNMYNEYADDQPCRIIYPSVKKSSYQSFDEPSSTSSSYLCRQSSKPHDDRTIKIVKYVSMSKIPTTEDKSSQTISDIDLERQQSLSVQSRYATNSSPSSNFFSDSRNLRQYKSAKSFSPTRVEWSEPMKSTNIVPRQTSFSPPPTRKQGIITNNDCYDDEINKTKNLHEPEICIKKKLSQGANHYIYITHGRNSP
ncbi:hypothetical protein EWB00_011114 [Schistosoma japonicum]|uniref:SJCHGC05741 protein n=1 Tax=Schistosoma japonicum TaxID=6182 RepID=Q5DEK0_SCHJA|nr:SJCHGC05741 protein [Schistosoma japonicum]KAH8875777.1 hypothetical protein KSF78_0004742 [Schistosoma japonicum]TNN17378.1 hypothetical protein EWB00_011114 [Schistosoma japonicum]